MKRTLLLLATLIMLSANTIFAESNKTKQEEGVPVITASATELMFYNYDVQYLNIYGENLIEDISCEIRGEGGDHYFYLYKYQWNDQERNLGVFFDPWESGIYRASLVLSSEGAEGLVIPLTGVTTWVSTSMVYFGEVSVGTSSGVGIIRLLGIDPTKEDAYHLESDNDSFDIVHTQYNPETLEGELHIVFSPKEIKYYYTHLEINTGNGNYYSLPMSGTGREGFYEDYPYIKILPEYIGTLYSNIGETSIGYFRVEKYNLSEDISYEIIGDDSNSYSLVLTEDDPDGTFKSYIVEFTPTKSGYRNAQIVFSSEGAESKTLQVTGYGYPYLSVDPYHLDFGKVAVMHETKTLAVTVTGGIDTEVTYTVNDPAFTVEEHDWDPATGGTLHITFKPMELKNYSSQIRFQTGNTWEYVYLWGSGAELPGYPHIAVDRTDMEFFNPYILTESETQIITITGEKLSEAIQYEIIDSENGSDFTVTENSWDPLTGGTLSVTYTPSKNIKEDTAIESAYATIVFSNPETINKQVNLIGSAISVFNTPDRLLFGNVPISTTSNPQSIYVSGINLKKYKYYTIFGQDQYYFDFDISFDPDTYVSKIDVTFSPTEDWEREYYTEFNFGYDYYYRHIYISGYGVKDYTSIETLGGDNDKVQIYPNPAIDMITIKADDLKPGDTIEIYSIKGVKVNSSKVEGINTTVDVSALPSGMYIVLINDVYRKFVKL